MAPRVDSSLPEDHYLGRFANGKQENREIIYASCQRLHGHLVYAVAGLLDGKTATNRKNGDFSEKIIPIDRLAQLAPKCRIDRHRIVDTGRIITGGGITSGLEMGFYLLERFGYDEKFVNDTAYIMEYEKQWQLMKDDRLVVA